MDTHKLLARIIALGILFIPLLDAGVRIGNTRIAILNLYCFAILFLGVTNLFQSRQTVIRQMGKFSLLLFLLPSIWILSLLFAEDVTEGISSLVRELLLLSFALSVASTIRTVKNLHFYILIFSAALLLNSIVGWTQIMLGNDSIRFLRPNISVNVNASYYMSGEIRERTSTLFGNSLFHGFFQAVGISLIWGWLLRACARKRIILWALIGFTLPPLLTSGSRGPVISLLFSVFFMWFLLTNSFRISFLRAVGIVFLVILFAGFMETTSFIPAVGIIDTFSRLTDFSASSIESSRINYWEYVLHMSYANPWGVGLGNYALTAVHFVPSSLLYVLDLPRNHAESMYLTQLVELGFLGLAVFTFLIIYACKQCILIARNQDNEALSYLAGLSTSWLTIATAFITCNYYENNGIAVMFWFFVALAMGSIKLNRAYVAATTPVINNSILYPTQRNLNLSHKIKLSV